MSSRWEHIVDRHPELEPYLEEILAATEHPAHHRGGTEPNEEWFIVAWAVPARWLQVVVHFTVSAGSITTAFGRSRLP